MRQKVILDSELAESLWRLPARSRREILAIFERLAEFPTHCVDQQLWGPDGRMVQRASFPKWHVYFWLDGAVDDLRILEVTRAN